MLIANELTFILLCQEKYINMIPYRSNLQFGVLFLQNFSILNPKLKPTYVYSSAISDSIRIYVYEKLATTTRNQTREWHDASRQL